MVSKKKRTSITFRLRVNDLMALDRLAKKNGISRAELVRRILTKAEENWP